MYIYIFTHLQTAAFKLWINLNIDNLSFVIFISKRWNLYLRQKKIDDRTC